MDHDEMTVLSSFETSLIVKDDFGLPFELVEDLVYFSAKLGRYVTVPKGFKTDLASIPMGLWNLLPRTGRYDRAAVIHDFLYQFNGVNRGEADSVLKEAMDVLKVGWRARLIYWGVRSGGWLTWKHYRDKDGKSGQSD